MEVTVVAVEVVVVGTSPQHCASAATDGSVQTGFFGSRMTKEGNPVSAQVSVVHIGAVDPQVLPVAIFGFPTSAAVQSRAPWAWHLADASAYDSRTQMSPSTTSWNMHVYGSAGKGTMPSRSHGGIGIVVVEVAVVTVAVVVVVVVEEVVEGASTSAQHCVDAEAPASLSTSVTHLRADSLLPRACAAIATYRPDGQRSRLQIISDFFTHLLPVSPFAGTLNTNSSMEQRRAPDCVQTCSAASLVYSLAKQVLLDAWPSTAIVENPHTDGKRVVVGTNPSASHVFSDRNEKARAASIASCVQTPVVMSFVLAMQRA